MGRPWGTVLVEASRVLYLSGTERSTTRRRPKGHYPGRAWSRDRDGRPGRDPQASYRPRNFPGGTGARSGTERRDPLAHREGSDPTVVRPGTTNPVLPGSAGGLRRAPPDRCGCDEPLARDGRVVGPARHRSPATRKRRVLAFGAAPSVGPVELATHPGA